MFLLSVTLVLVFYFVVNVSGNAKISQDSDSSEADKDREILSTKKYLSDVYGGTFDDTGELRNSQNPDKEQDRKILIAKQYLAQLDDATTETWIDPYDMLNYQASSFDDVNKKVGLQKNEIERKFKKETTIKILAPENEIPRNKPFQNVLSSPGSNEILDTNAPKEKDCAEYDYVYLKRWLKIFLNKMNVNPDVQMEEIKFVQFSVANHELLTLQDMLGFESQDISTVDKIVSKIVADAHVVSSRKSWLATTTTFVTSDMFLFSGAIILCLIFLFNIYHCFLNHPVKTFFIVLFLSSFIMSWFSLYQKKVAEKFATLDSVSYSTECRKDNLGYLSYFSFLIKKSFFNLGDDCAKYYEAQMVDPIFRVSPVMAISETLANMVFQPLGPMGNHLNTFIKEFFSGIPYIVIIPGTIFAFLVLLIICRYKIRMPFLLGSLEPSSPTHDSNMIDNIPQNVIDRNKRCPVIQMSELHIHIMKDKETVETGQLQSKDLSYTERNKMIDSTAEESTSFSQLKNSNKSTNNAQVFVINGSGDNTDVNGGEKTGICLLNSNEYGDSLIETLETSNGSLKEELINLAHEDELPFEEKVM